MKTHVFAGLMFGAFLGSVAAQTAAPPAAAPTVPPNPKYSVNKEWAQLPAGMTWDASTSNITPDGKGNVTVLVRKAPFFRVFNREGKFVKSWGDDPAMFAEAHNLVYDRDGIMWAIDSNGHVVHKFSADGKVLMTLGKRGVAGDNTSQDTFNRPDGIAFAPNGDIYVSDGYVNARVVQFSKDGKFIRIIGGVKGSEPGQLQLPHGVVVDSKGRIIVADSDNKRIAVFDNNGKFIENWPFLSRGGMLITRDDLIYVSDVNAGTVTMIKDGKQVDVIGGLGRPHGVGLDVDGAIYVSDALNKAVMKITPKK
jgi:sugar lactone lactonase YvrE